MIFDSLTTPRLIELLNSSAVGVLPTDTVYGLACPAADEQAVACLYALKSRENKPGTVIAASIDQLVELGLKHRYLKAVEQFWPNPISIEIPHQINYLNQDTGRQAFRIVKGPEEIIKLLQKVGPLLTSSANQPGKPPASNLEEAQQYFGDQVDFYVDGGDMTGREPSTLIRIVDDAIEVLRQGAVQVDESGHIQA